MRVGDGPEPSRGRTASFEEPGGHSDERMPPGSASASEPDRWVGSRDDVGLFAVVLGFALLVATPAFDYLLLGPGADAGDGPTTALALLVVLAVGAAMVVSSARDRLEELLDPPGEGETVWHDIRRFGFVVLGASIVLSLPASILVDWGEVPTSLALAAHHLVLVGLSLGVLALRRREWPADSLRGMIDSFEVDTVSVDGDGDETDDSGAIDDAAPAADPWDVWDYVALFAGVFLMVYWGISSDYEVFIVGGAGLGVVFASVAVGLRRAGALVPDEDDEDGAASVADDVAAGSDGEATGTD